MGYLSNWVSKQTTPFTIDDLANEFPSKSRKAIVNLLHYQFKIGNIVRLNPGEYIQKRYSGCQPDPQKGPVKPTSLTAVQVGESIIEMIDKLKKENDQLWTDLSECMESRDRIQARYNKIKMSEKTLTIKDLTRG